MGLSASQARLLSITARLSDNELHSQQIANAKVRLADQTQEASREYVNSLDAQKLVYTMYDAKGNSTQVNFTPAIMYEYAEMKNQYGISNNAGQLLVKKSDAVNFMNSNTFQEFYENYVTSSTPINPAWTEQENIKMTLDNYKNDLEVLKGEKPLWNDKIPPEPPEKYVESIGEKPQKPEKEDIEYWTEIPASTETIHGLKELATDEISNGRGINAGYRSLAAQNSAYDSLIESAIAIEQKLAPLVFLITSDDKGEYEYNLSNEEGNVLTIKYTPNDRKWTNTSLTADNIGVSQDDLTRYNDTISENDIQKENILKLYHEALAIISLYSINGDTDTDEYYSNRYYSSSLPDGQSIKSNGYRRGYREEFNNISGDFVILYNGDSVIGKTNEIFDNIFTNDDGKFYFAQHIEDDTVFDETISYSSKWVFKEDAFNTALDEWEIQYDIWEKNKEIYELCQEYGINLQEDYDNLVTKYEEYKTWQEKCSELERNIEITKYLTDITVQKYDKETNAHCGWYYNLWCRMNGGEGTLDEEHNIYKTPSNSTDPNSDRYWKVLEDNLFNSASWLQFALEQGLVTLEQVQFVDPAESGTGLANAKWQSKIFTTCTDIQFIDDETAVAKAEAIYTRKLNEIEAKDKKYDNDIKKLDTEHNALQTEYESVKSVVDKNIERSFKAFS